MRVEVLLRIKDKIRGRYLGRHLDHLADSIAKLSLGKIADTHFFLNYLSLYNYGPFEKQRDKIL